MTIFEEVHTGLPREAPGSRTSTQMALSMVELPAKPGVLDIGCGPGAQTLDLADSLPHATIHAIDLHAPFIDELKSRLSSSTSSAEVIASIRDMRTLEFEDKSFDLIWSEGAAYIMGVANALDAWRPLLKPGGFIAYTDAVWLKDDPPVELGDWWRAGYPDMTTPEIQRQRLVAHGFELMGDFILPSSDWWNYYKPMETRIRELHGKHAGDPDALKELADHQQEIDFYRDYDDYYSYMFLVGRRIV